MLNIVNNTSLNSLSGLENINPNSITDLSIYNNPQLSDCDIQSVCDYLVAPAGFVDIHDNTAGCNSQIEVEDDCNNNCLPDGIEFETQAAVDNFQTNYPGCSEIEGDVTIGKFMNSSNITNVEGLDVLTSIGGFLDIRLNNDLESLAGLSNINSVGGLVSVYNNDALTDLTGLNQITSVNDALYIIYNDALTSIEGLANLVTISNELAIRENTVLPDLSGLENLNSIGGNFDLRANTILSSISALGGLNSVGNDIWIGGNENLESLTGLEGLSSIEGYLLINYNYELTEITGLNNLTSIGGYLEFRDNYVLPNLEGLNNLVSIGGYMEMRNNDALENLDALEGLTSIGAEFRVSDNDILTSLSGLDNIEASSIFGLYIHDNAVLATCDIESVCNYLADPNGAIYINDNATGCYNQEEVEDACFIGIKKVSTKDTFRISPNPLESITVINYTIPHKSPVTIKIFDLARQEIKTLVNEIQQQGEQQIIFNTSDLPSGVYFCTLKTNNGILTKKIIKL